MAALVLADRSRWIPHTLAVLGICSLVALNLVAPAAFVAEPNVARVIDPSLVPPDGHAGLDADYLAVLPDDAIPVARRRRSRGCRPTERGRVHADPRSAPRRARGRPAYSARSPGTSAGNGRGRRSTTLFP